ncbi:MAG: V-type ATPase subunit [Myxococcales bacterium]|nr:V-type ATPase subunit [Myxococcales bacterium]
MTWVDLVARARGLATHLASDAALADLDRAHDRASLAAALARAGLPAIAGADDPGAPATVEAAATARAAAELAILERWAGARAGALAVLVDDQDRRSLRGLIRGLVAGAPAAARLTGAVPTSRLPAATLRALAAQPTAAALAAALTRCAHPAAAALAAPLAQTPLDLLGVERALTAWFAARARVSARADAALAVHVAQVIDVANAGAALALAARGRTLEPDASFVDGGRRLARPEFVAAATATPAIAATALARSFGGTPVADALTDAAPDAVERAALVWHLATQRRLARAAPLGLAPVLSLVLRRRAETRRVRHAAWRIALGGAP